VINRGYGKVSFWSFSILIMEQIFRYDGSMFFENVDLLLILPIFLLLALNYKYKETEVLLNNIKFKNFTSNRNSIALFQIQKRQNLQPDVISRIKKKVPMDIQVNINLYLKKKLLKISFSKTADGTLVKMVIER
jgi:hypothetical protein